MKKIALLLCFILLVAACFTGCNDSDTVTINVYNWGQYMSLGEEGAIDINKEFYERTGIRVNYMLYDSNETMYTKLKTGGSSIDVIIPSDYMIERLIAEDMLEKLNYENIPNYSKVDEQFKGLVFDPNNEYSVPYTFGTVGIIYNKKYVDNVTSWNSLWDKKYEGKVLMFDNCRDAFGIAQYLLGYDVNSTSETEYEACYNKLVEQRPVVQQYVMDQIFDSMINEEAWIAPYYAGDYLTMAEDNEDLAFAFPEEGFNYFVDAMCIVKGSEHKAEAEAYINFLCDPEISAKNMDAIGYSTPISAAKEYMESDFKNSAIAYPDEKTLSRATMFQNLPDPTIQSMNSYWSKVNVQ